mmetsp:Transcript_12475/g.38456  ORF Transcript_12475/g.38456 Transcript_12475/m.38456 type:complete len:767 (-) Transcript_12475:11-2311(-)
MLRAARMFSVLAVPAATLLQSASALAAPAKPTPQSLQAKAPTAEGLTFADVAKLPRPGSQGVAMAKFSPCGKWLTHLSSADGSLTTQLYATDVATGSTKLAFAAGEAGEPLSKEEQMRRERARIMATGVTSYAWASKADALLVPSDGAVFVKDGVDGAAKRLFDPAAFPDVGAGPVLDPKISDDGATVAFVWDDEVCAVDASGGAPRRLTDGARGVAGVTNGAADLVAAEEMDRYDGFWLAPGGKTVAYESVDETGVLEIHIPRPGDAAGTEETHRYPFAGAANPKVRLGAVATAGGATTWLDLGAAGLGEDVYLARVDWADATTVLATVQSRDQRTLRVVAYDVATGAGRVALEDTRKDAWLNLHDALRWGIEKDEVLYASEKDGFRRLYVHDASSGAEKRCLTAGPLVVEDLVGVERGVVYFLGNDAANACRQRHLYKVPYDGSEAPRRITEAGYTDAAAVSKDGAVFLQRSTAATPVVAELRAKGATTVLKDSSDDPRAAGLQPPKPFETTSTDGAATLHGSLYLPDAAVHGPGPYPTLVSCYGGPHVQYCQDKWATATADLRAQHLRDRGYLVVKIDNRGSARRGLAFEAAVHGKFGCLEVDDQVAGVNYAVRAGLADAARVGIYGWSYGGYLSAMCLAKAPDVFRCAVAGAPVASWDGYDTHYTERYMSGGPLENPDGYKEGDVCTHVGNVQGALMLVHGLLDENVHFRHTARIAQAMIDAGKVYELLCFPNERHSPRSEKDRAYQEQRVFAFVEKWLKET